MRMQLSIAPRRTRPHLIELIGFLLAWALVVGSCHQAAGQLVANSEIRPFVVGVIPVVGPRGVGGVAIDAAGAVARAEADLLGELRKARAAALAPVDAKLGAASPLRKVSLGGLARALDECRRDGRPVDDALQNLAGLTRIEFVFVFPPREPATAPGDIVIAGPAEGWHIGDEGSVVGLASGRPVLQLDDLVVALRTARPAAVDRGISCSIDPTEEGLKRLRPLLHARKLTDATVTRLEEALGPQQITITGVPPASHFARTMVAADFLMKRLGMGFERSPIDGLPSYLELIASRGATPKTAMPRWWLAADYEPLLKDEAGLAWQLRGRGVRALSEDGYLAAAGDAVSGKDDSLSEKWATAMTERYAALAKAMPVFGELRNCMDLAVLAALLVKENLPERAHCDLELLLDERRLNVAEYHVPHSVASRASFVRKGTGWILSLSGGVQIDSWSAASRAETSGAPAEQREAAGSAPPGRWWWD